MGGVNLSVQNKRQLWIGRFCPWFLTMSEHAEFLYKTTNYYQPCAERSILWNDATLSIAWPESVISPTLSSKDAQASSFEDAELF